MPVNSKSIKTTFSALYLLPALFLLFGCIEEYNPDLSSDQDLLVIDGSIIRGDSIQQVMVSKTTPIGQNEFLPVPGCVVHVEDDLGNIYVFENTFPGIYQATIDQANLEVGRQYKLQVNTPDGETYESEWETIYESSPIDSVYYLRETYQSSAEFINDGLRFYVDLKAPEGNTRHYRWKITETYSYSAVHDIRGYRDFELDTFWVYLRPTDSLRHCWRTNKLGGLYSSSTGNLTVNEKKRIPLNYIPHYDVRLSETYSVLVKQYSLGEGAYEYWEQNRVLTGESGGLYQSQPAQSVTNVSNINDPDKRVIGYFWASESSEKRAFFVGPLSKYRYSYDCVLYDTLTIVPLDSIRYSLDTIEYSSFITVSYVDPASLTEYFSTGHDFCFDCRKQGGTIEKPDFMP